MNLCSDGITRDVYLTRRWAIKIPTLRRWRHFIQGILANMTERDIWQSANIPGSYLAPYRDDLCPVVWAAPGGWCVVMKRVAKMPEGEWCKAAAPERLKGVINDIKPDNFGMLDGRAVCLDYGGYIWMMSDCEYWIEKRKGVYPVDDRRASN